MQRAQALRLLRAQAKETKPLADGATDLGAFDLNALVGGVNQLGNYEYVTLRAITRAWQPLHWCIRAAKMGHNLRAVIAALFHAGHIGHACVWSIWSCSMRVTWYDRFLSWPTLKMLTNPENADQPRKC
jgi:hypothetical protein